MGFETSRDKQVSEEYEKFSRFPRFSPQNVISEALIPTRWKSPQIHELESKNDIHEFLKKTYS